MAGSRSLNIVDEHGAIVGEATRETIHREGLLHREAHVWFYTPSGDIIFQHRSEKKDTYPDLLDSTVGGHVEIGSDYDHTALQEMREETGIEAATGGLTHVLRARIDESDPVTGTRNNVIRAIYIYCYNGEVTGLKVEEGEASGFESLPLDKLPSISRQDRARFVPGTIEEVLSIAAAIRDDTQRGSESDTDNRG